VTANDEVSHGCGTAAAATLDADPQTGPLPAKPIGGAMSTTNGQRRGIPATFLSVLAVLLVGVMLTLTAGASRAAAETTQGNAVHTRQALYILPEQGYVELLVLEITGSSLSGSALTDVYNCGNNQVSASRAIAMLGSVYGNRFVDFRFYGIPGSFFGLMGPSYLDVTGPSGDTVRFGETNTARLGEAVVQDEAPVYWISGHTCSDLPATYWP
jgi:hypothetical protein